MSDNEPKDLIVLVADGHIGMTIGTLLKERCRELGISEISYDIIEHPEKDPGCRVNCVEYLRLYSGYRHACVVFDRDGSGETDRSKAEDEIEGMLSRNGWNGRCVAIAIEPELESWIWTSSIHTARALGWNTSEELLKWLREKSLLECGQCKPKDPVKAMKAALSERNRKRSANVFRQIAKKSNLEKCQDGTFQKFQDTLRKWFPSQPLP